MRVLDKMSRKEFYDKYDFKILEHFMPLVSLIDDNVTFVPQFKSLKEAEDFVANGMSSSNINILQIDNKYFETHVINKYDDSIKELYKNRGKKKFMMISILTDGNTSFGTHAVIF